MKTAPSGIGVHASSIPDAGLGAFADVSIAAHTVIGEYEGDTVVQLPHTSHENGLYRWQVQLKTLNYSLVLLLSVNYIVTNGNVVSIC